MLENTKVFQNTDEINDYLLYDKEPLLRKILRLDHSA